MIGIDVLVVEVSGLQRQELERWIANDWVRPDGTEGHYAFRDIDVARVRLIQQLREDMAIDDNALPVVLSLLDQVYALRRRLRDVAGRGS
jgi:chaperone modulatory protein CbpM